MKVRRWWQRVCQRVCGCVACVRHGGLAAGLLVSVGKHESFVVLCTSLWCFASRHVLLDPMPPLVYNTERFSCALFVFCDRHPVTTQRGTQTAADMRGSRCRKQWAFTGHCDHGGQGHLVVGGLYANPRGGGAGVIVFGTSHTHQAAVRCHTTQYFCC